MDLFNVTLQAGSIGVPFTMVGRYLRIIEAAAPVKVRTDTGIESQILPGLGGDLSNPVTGEAFTRFDLASDETQTVQVLVSTFPVTDNRIVGSINAQAVAHDSIVGLPKISPAAAGVQTVAGNIGRYRLDIQASADNTATVWVGGDQAGVGQRLDPGDTYSATVSGAVSLYFEGAAEVYLSEVV